MSLGFNDVLSWENYDSCERETRQRLAMASSTTNLRFEISPSRSAVGWGTSVVVLRSANHASVWPLGVVTRPSPETSFARVNVQPVMSRPESLTNKLRTLLISLVWSQMNASAPDAELPFPT